MVPRVTSKGGSFAGAGAYFLHDLGKSATQERVAFTHTVNMLTNDATKAIKVMAWTAMHAGELKELSGQTSTGRKAANPVYNYVLAWAPDQNPTREEMINFSLRSLETLGLSEHEALLIAHNDTYHQHIHVMVNRVHPVTGLMAKMSHDQNKLSRLAEAYERESGHIYCEKRVTNNRRRDHGEKYVKAEREERLVHAADYQRRRAERVMAQRRAGELTHKRKQQAVQAEMSKEAFNKAAVLDVVPPPVVSTSVADTGGVGHTHGVDNAVERDNKAQHVGADSPQDTVVAREAQKAAWALYEAKQWQALDERHAAAHEQLRDEQVTALWRQDQLLEVKFGQLQDAADRRVEACKARIQPRGLRALAARLTGEDASTQHELQALQSAASLLRRQRDDAQRLLVERQHDAARQLIDQHVAERLELQVQLKARLASLEHQQRRPSGPEAAQPAHARLVEQTPAHRTDPRANDNRSLTSARDGEPSAQRGQTSPIQRPGARPLASTAGAKTVGTTAPSNDPPLSARDTLRAAARELQREAKPSTKRVRERGANKDFSRDR